MWKFRDNTYGYWEKEKFIGPSLIKEGAYHETLEVIDGYVECVHQVTREYLINRGYVEVLEKEEEITKNEKTGQILKLLEENEDCLKKVSIDGYMEKIKKEGFGKECSEKIIEQFEKGDIKGFDEVVLDETINVIIKRPEQLLPPPKPIPPGIRVMREGEAEPRQKSKKKFSNKR